MTEFSDLTDEELWQCRAALNTLTKIFLSKSKKPSDYLGEMGMELLDAKGTINLEIVSRWDDADANGPANANDAEARLSQSAPRP